LCGELNEYFICPVNSDVLEIQQDSDSVKNSSFILYIQLIEKLFS